MKFPGVKFLETTPKFKKRKKNASSCVYVLHKTSHQEISRRSRAVMAKKCTIKCNAHTELLFFLLSLVLFLTFSLPSPSSLLKLPIDKECTVMVFVFSPNDPTLPQSLIGSSVLAVSQWSGECTRTPTLAVERQLPPRIQPFGISCR